LCVIKACKYRKADTDVREHNCSSDCDHDDGNDSLAKDSDPTYEPNMDSLTEDCDVEPDESDGSREEVLYATSKLRTICYLTHAVAALSHPQSVA